MGGAALVDLGRHHPDVGRELARDLDQGIEAGRMDAVVVGDEDAGLGDVARSHLNLRLDGAAMTSVPPM